jgi:hypothetical protein
LEAPVPQSSYGGEYEGAEWWEDHEELLSRARAEWGHKHEDLYHDWNYSDFIEPNLLKAMEAKDVEMLQRLVEATNVEGVYRLQIFTDSFVRKVLEELEHNDASGIPTRRPNGMNRYGAMLDQLGLEQPLMESIAQSLLHPLAQVLFSDFVSMDDVAELYSFVVRYHPNEDVELAEHTDASAVTVNICLVPDSKERSPLYFKEKRLLGGSSASTVDSNKPMDATFVTLDQPGMAVIHLGQHVHGVAPVRGARSNLVVWLFGEHGYVRVAPYTQEEVRQNQKQWAKMTQWKMGASSDLQDILRETLIDENEL